MADIDDSISRAEQAIEALDPVAPEVERVFYWPDAGGTFKTTSFVQAKLAHFPSMEFGTIAVKIMRDVVNGRYGVDLVQLWRDRDQLMSAQAVTEHSHDGQPHEHALDFDQLPDEGLELLYSMHRAPAVGDGWSESRDEMIELLKDQHAEFLASRLEETIKQWKPYIEAFLQVLEEVPELQQEVIALALGVRRRDREAFKEQISESTPRGGLSIDDAVDIIKVFIRQNSVQIRRLLGKQLREIGVVLMEEVGMEVIKTEDQGSTGGTPSSTSPAPTPG